MRRRQSRASPGRGGEGEPLEALVRWDAETALPNRLALYQALQRALASREREQRPTALLVLGINAPTPGGAGEEEATALGHWMGCIGDELCGQLRERDTLVRLGSREIGVLAPFVRSYSDAAGLAEKLLATLAVHSVPCEAEGGGAGWVTHIGLTFIRAEDQDAEPMQERAQQALRQARERGERLVCPDPELGAESRARIELAAAFGEDYARGGLTLHYQPQYELASGEPVGMEALLRWPRADGWVSPGRFIPLLERTGGIAPVGTWVLQRACRDAQAWLEQGFQLDRVGVNVASCQLEDEAFAHTVRQILAETGLAAQRLELEITETLLARPDQVILGNLHNLRRMGVRVAVDDFGVGYSALTYLKDLPVDRLKLDRSFVQDLVTDSRSKALAEAIIGLAARLSHPVIAEGVEEPEQLEALRALGCAEVQGFLLGRPAPFEAQSLQLPRTPPQA